MKTADLYTATTSLILFTAAMQMFLASSCPGPRREAPAFRVGGRLAQERAGGVRVEAVAPWLEVGR